jgi:hypothetical protein
MTLQELWKQYRDHVSPREIPADQNRETHQAFMSGAFAALTEWVRIAREVEDVEEAARRLGKLLQEGEEWCRLRANALNQPRN